MTGDSSRAPLAGDRCEVRPPFVPNFEPELEWQWTGSSIMPTHNQVMMTPVVVDVNQDGIPDVLFNSFQGGNYTSNGVLRAISGDDGHDLWAVTDPAYRVRGAASIAAANIDSDPQVEICTIPENGAGIICFEHDGTFKFRTSTPANNWGGVSFADLDGDGHVEILDGNTVFDAAGHPLWAGSDGVGGISGTGPISFAADIDQDGLLEVVNDRAVYRHDGTIKCVNTSIGHGLAAVGNFDQDPEGEIVVVWGSMVSLLDDDCRELWRKPLPGGGAGGAPNIADFDNDGMPEIGVAGANQYTVFEHTGAVKWSKPVQDLSSNRTGSSTFDFEGDGKSEVIYGDEHFLRIYDGSTGAVRFEVPNSSGTTYENPVIADVDGDNNAEIVVCANDYAWGNTHGIRVFRDRNDGWVNTRGIWNQHAYSVTNVNDDGSIPAHPATNWLTAGLNTFRSNSQGTGTRSPFAAPDLTASDVAAQCTPSTQTLALSATVHNQGDAAASAGLNVAFYRGDPASGGTLLGVATVPARIEAGAQATATLSLHPAPGGLADVWAVADDDGTGTGREVECVETNNAGSAHLDLRCEQNLPPVAVCRNVTVSAGPACSGSGSVDNGSYDPDNQPDPLVVTEAPQGPFGLGSHAVTLTASDGAATDSCQGTVTVVDDTPPALSCPAPQVLECNAGSAVATYAPVYSDNCSVQAGCSPASGSTFPVGVTPVACSATDGSGNQSSCGFSVTVRDTQGPVAGGSKGLTLWPPNHKYRSLSLSDCAEDPVDQCQGTLPIDHSGRITRVTSDEVEDDNGVGDGQTCADMVITGQATVDLRSEREGTSDGRVYTLYYVVTDPAGNTTSSSCTVTVPHDQSGRPAVDGGAAYCVGEGCPGGTAGSPACR